MSRPSANLDKKLIQAGKKIISKEGSQGLTIPKICQTANVNLGMFNYHFKTRDNYISILYENIRCDMLNFLKLEEVSEENALNQLKHAMLRLCEYTKKHQKFMRFLIIDGLITYKEIKKYIDRGIVRRYSLVPNLISKAQEDNLLKDDIPTMEIYSSLMLGVLGPEIFKKEFISREKSSGLKNPHFANYPSEKRLNNILKEYIVENPTG